MTSFARRWGSGIVEHSHRTAITRWQRLSPRSASGAVTLEYHLRSNRFVSDPPNQQTSPLVLPPALSKWFAADIRARGDHYLASGNVRISHASAAALQASVTGTQMYTVDITARDGALQLGCTCPYASEFGVCKHLWAVLRQSDADGTLTAIAKTAGPRPTPSFLTKFGNLSDDGHVDHEQGEPNAPEPPPVFVMPDWMRVLDNARRQMQFQTQYPAPPAPAKGQIVWPENKRLVYILDLDATASSAGIVIDIGTETLARDGTWGEAKRFTLGAPVWFAHPNAIDRQIAEMLTGSNEAMLHGNIRVTAILLGMRTFATTLRMILDTGRCRLRSSKPGLTGRTIHFDDGAPWKFRVRVRRDELGAITLSGMLARDNEEMPLEEPLLLSAYGFLITKKTIARFDHAESFALVYELRQHGAALAVPESITELLAKMYALPHVPELDLPADLSVAESRENPVPALTVTNRVNAWRGTEKCHLACQFHYGEVHLNRNATTTSVFDKTTGVLHHRQTGFEQTAIARLMSLGAREEWDHQSRHNTLVVSRTKLTSMMVTLLRDGWRVQTEGMLYRTPGGIFANVSSGIDWFDLNGYVRYGETNVNIATILDARRRGDEYVRIDDGSLGLMPEEWLEKLGPLIAAGNNVNGSTRFRRSQLSLLDALLATLPDASLDQTFERARTELAGFASVGAVDPPATFNGTLREYQREGLGWLHFLRKFELGGCLADDMGLGKTVQVLALLEARRTDGHGPSIVVVPRSLVFNWIREAERFTPALRLLDFSGNERQLESIDATNVDVVVTTYGTLRRDAPKLANIEFDYAILDEAQAIKNAGTSTAKASRLLRARHRLAMTGTPIENRIEELWSLLEFLNPGMFGAATKFSTLARLPSVDGGATASGHELLARALKPVILRRTKERVASELPMRTEQTLEVDMEPKQRKFYESIRIRVQRRVMDQVSQQGIKKSQFHILEGLLRLRQAACHPVLVDPTKSELPSAKLDALVPALASIAAEGHKALVFSQFTTFLALVRERLDASGIRYEYLDGKTRDRQAPVERFQSDLECPVFLISLKAGGHGLNLTAADYVYLLDPWWNPAVEAQAIDRAHRIGQTRHVMATRLIARDTIESKILQLQASKRALADAVLTENKGGLASIGRDELELLLGL